MESDRRTVELVDVLFTKNDKKKVMGMEREAAVVINTDF